MRFFFVKGCDGRKGIWAKDEIKLFKQADIDLEEITSCSRFVVNRYRPRGARAGNDICSLWHGLEVLLWTPVRKWRIVGDLNFVVGTAMTDHGPLE